MSRLPVQERAQKTRRRLLMAARIAFTEHGFAGASMEQIAEWAGVTRGPLYHFFDDKLDLFRAVYEEIEGELAAQMNARIQARAAVAADVWQEVRLGCQTYLDICLAPDIQRIALLEAPIVLGGGVGRHVSSYGLAMMREGLRRSIEQGAIEPQPVEPLAHVLRAALTAGAIYIARAEDHASARAEVGAAIDGLLEGMRL